MFSKSFFYLMVGSTCGLLAGCENFMNNQPPIPFQPTTKIVEKPVVIKPPMLQMKYSLSDGSNPALERAYQLYIRTGQAKTINGDGFVQFPYGATQPTIATSPFELTVISLEPGEQVTNVSSGDPQRWSYSMAYSGQGKMRQAHIMIKPSQPGVSTDLVITTDKRMYTLKMVTASGGKYVRNVKFWYPLDIQKFWDDYNAQQTNKLAKDQQEVVDGVKNCDITQINDDYSINAGWFNAPSFRPLKVFDCGEHTYIKFSSLVSTRDMPALFIQNGDTQELVNYRSKPPYFVVDKIFKKAVLVSGVGSNQQKVIITNNRY